MAATASSSVAPMAACQTSTSRQADSFTRQAITKYSAPAKASSARKMACQPEPRRSRASCVSRLKPAAA
ncbi:MAG TPA: hypothetical protein DCW72_07615 [Elusimicrobia bacterium]|nr:hypothetical protein [Elusimicrobiota bacterium]